MDGYVTKPIDPVELIRTIISLVPALKVGGQASLMAVPVAEKPKPQAPPAEPPPAATAGDARTVPIDIVSLEKRCMGNRKLAVKALTKFETIVNADLESIQEGIRSGNAKSVAASAHKIKGAAGNISAEDVRRIASDLEMLGRQDQLANAQASLEQLQSEVERFRQYLSSAVADLSGPAVAASQNVMNHPERRNA